MKLVRLPHGSVNVPITLDEDQVNLLVKAALEKEVARRVDSILSYSVVTSYMQNIIKDRIDRVLMSAPESDGLRDRVTLAVDLWLSAREGWIAKVLRRTHNTGVRRQ